MINSLFWMIVVFAIATIIVGVVNGVNFQDGNIDLFTYSLILTILTLIVYVISAVIRR